MIKENIHDLSYLLPCLKSLSFVCLNDSFLFEVWWLYFERGKWKSVCEVIQWKSKWKHKWKSKIIKQYYFIILRSPPKVQIYTNITILLLAGYYIVTIPLLYYYQFVLPYAHTFGSTLLCPVSALLLTSYPVTSRSMWYCSGTMLIWENYMDTSLVASTNLLNPYYYIFVST